MTQIQATHVRLLGPGLEVKMHRLRCATVTNPAFSWPNSAFCCTCPQPKMPVSLLESLPATLSHPLQHWSHIYLVWSSWGSELMHIIIPVHKAPKLMQICLLAHLWHSWVCAEGLCQHNIQFRLGHLKHSKYITDVRLPGSDVRLPGYSPLSPFLCVSATNTGRENNPLWETSCISHSWKETVCETTVGFAANCNLPECTPKVKHKCLIRIWCFS